MTLAAPSMSGLQAKERLARAFRRGINCAWLFVAAGPVMASPFATVVYEFAPAPGQFVNHAEFNRPSKALGAPVGGGLRAADNTSVVSLGGFGGSITLGFDHTVEDDPLNPLGMDAIVFGNAFYAGGNPNRHWAECATIEISRDANGNGLADDPWYLIAGSHIAVPADHRLIATWDDDTGDSTFPPEQRSWIPPGSFGVWQTQGYVLPAEIFGTIPLVNPSADLTVEAVFGYADYSPTLPLGEGAADGLIDTMSIHAATAVFYTKPDDPFEVGVSEGSGGGDAFDIAWAVDPATGLAAGIAAFDFIRITSAVSVEPSLLGEISTEVEAVSDVAPDPFGDVDLDRDVDLFDLAELQTCFGIGPAGGTECEVFDRGPDGVVDLADATTILGRTTGPRMAE